MSVPPRRASRRPRPSVEVRAKDDARGMEERIKKQVRKSVRKAVEESLAEEVLELRELVRALGEEREALAALLRRVEATIAVAPDDDDEQEEEVILTPPPPAPRRTEEDVLTSSSNVTEDIMGAIAKVGFPDGFSVPSGDPAEVAATEAPASLPSAEDIIKDIVDAAEDAAEVASEGEEAVATTTTLAQMPVVTVGCDDIPLMALLHESLASKGFYCTDDEREDWYFGDTTQNAVMSLQSSRGLTENGVVDAAVWAELLPVDFVWERRVDDKAAIVDLDATEAPAPPPASPAAVEKVGNGDGGGSSEAADVGDFPMLREGDGGEHVRLLQVALDSKGFCVSEDELEYWMFGDTTETALKTFQACNGMPESGVVDEGVWAALCDDLDCSVDFLAEKTSGTSEADVADPYNIDRTKGGVFLLGEGRYEDPTRLGG